MRTFLLFVLLMAGISMSSGLAAAPYFVPGMLDNARLSEHDEKIVLVQKRKFRRNFRIRRDLRRFPAGPSRVIRSGSGVLRDQYNRGVRTRGNSAQRDIGAGQAVITAQSHLPGTVLGVRRSGNVYNVKILDRNRVRIISVNAATGQVVR